MNKYNFELKCGQSGFLNDGRFFNIISIPSIMMSSDGNFKYGDIEVSINNEHYVMRISEFIECIKSIGDLEIRDDSLEIDGK